MADDDGCHTPGRSGALWMERNARVAPINWDKKLPHLVAAASVSPQASHADLPLPALPPLAPPKDKKIRPAAKTKAMDFFTRLASDVTRAVRPQKQDGVAKFSKHWKTIEDTLSDFSGKLADQVPPVEKTDIPICMRELVKILLNEDKFTTAEDPTGPW